MRTGIKTLVKVHLCSICETYFSSLQFLKAHNWNYTPNRKNEPENVEKMVEKNSKNKEFDLYELQQYLLLKLWHYFLTMKRKMQNDTPLTTEQTFNNGNW